MQKLNKGQLGHFDGLVQERRNSIVNALELRFSCTIPSIYWRCCIETHRLSAVDVMVNGDELLGVSVSRVNLGNGDFRCIAKIKYQTIKLIR